ncbi:MAG: glycine cleavage system protein R [Kofleriaceae bacterium]
MRTTLLLTVVGADRPGLVEALAKRVAQVGGNWEECRLARLGGQFAGIVMVSLDGLRTDELVGELRALDSVGLQVNARSAEPRSHAPPGTRARLELTGADRPGIVRDVARVLATYAVNVEELESSVGSAPMSGEALFTARAELSIPEGVALGELRSALETLGGELMVDLSIERP